MNKFLTIYTPTFNRGHLLRRVYSSLLEQTCKEFKWLVIDDGSCDDTNQVVQKMIDENKIEIIYVFKENGGVHTARDMAYQMCDTELIVGCDSDDWLTIDAVKDWKICWENNKENVIGIYSVVIDADKKRITDVFPPMYSCSYQDYTYKYNCKYEKHTVIKKEIISQLPDFPVFEDEHLVGEAYKWIQLPIDGKFILMDKPTRVYQQQDDGYMRNFNEIRFFNPKGFRELYRQYIIHAKYIKPKLKGELGYIAYSLIARDRRIIMNSPTPIMTILMFPLGLIVYCIFYIRRIR